jgi:hypothetical protein
VKSEKRLIAWRRETAQSAIQQGVLAHAGPESFGIQDLRHLMQNPKDFLSSKVARAGTHRNEIDEANHSPLMKAARHAERAFGEHPTETALKNGWRKLLAERESVREGLNDLNRNLTMRNQEVQERLRRLAGGLRNGGEGMKGFSDAELTNLARFLPFAKAESVREMAALTEGRLTPEQAAKLVKSLTEAGRTHAEAAAASRASVGEIRSTPTRVGVTVETPDGPAFVTFDSASASLRPAVSAALKANEAGFMQRALWRSEAGKECDQAALQIGRAYGLTPAAAPAVTAAAQAATQAATTEATLGELAL